jgi:hypothetical protein
VVRKDEETSALPLPDFKNLFRKRLNNHSFSYNQEGENGCS